MIEPQMKAPPADVNTAVTDKYTEAYNLNVRICVNAQMAQQNLYEVCKGLKEMRDGKLYKELGYKNFEDYCENEVGIKRAQAYRLIDINSLPTDFVSSMRQIGTTKLALLAKLDEPQREEIQQTVDVEEVSVKELKAEIEKLKAEKSKLDEEKAGYKERQDKLLKKNIELVEERDKAQQKQEKLAAKLNAEGARSAELEKQIQELESRPRDSYEDTTKIEALKKELEEAEARHKIELASAQSAPAEDIKGIFKAHMMAAVDALKHLTQFTELHIDSPEKTIFIEKLVNVDILINQTISKLKGEK